MQVITSETHFKNKDGEVFIVNLDFFYREILVRGDGQKNLEARAIDNSSIRHFAWEASTTPLEFIDILVFFYGLMDSEGKMIMSKEWPGLETLQ